MNVQDWADIAFLHWAFRAEDIGHLLPEEMVPLTYDGMAWVTVTPFFIRVRPPGLPLVPPRWAFPETNLRTYVAGPDGRQGLWFLRMEVTAAWFVATLRALGLPYVRRQMSVALDGDRVAYRSRRRPASPAAGHDVVLRRGNALQPADGGPWERFVTARWGAYHRVGRQLLYTAVEHAPWRLQTADVEDCSVGALFRDAGLAAPTDGPIAQFSSGVRVRVGVPTPIGLTSSRH